MTYLISTISCWKFSQTQPQFGVSPQPGLGLVLVHNPASVWWQSTTQPRFGGSLQPSLDLVAVHNPASIWWQSTTQPRFGGSHNPASIWWQSQPSLDLVAVTTQPRFGGSHNPASVCYFYFIRFQPQCSYEIGLIKKSVLYILIIFLI